MLRNMRHTKGFSLGGSLLFCNKLSWYPSLPGPGSPVDQKKYIHGIQ